MYWLLSAFFIGMALAQKEPIIFIAAGLFAIADALRDGLRKEK